MFSKVIMGRKNINTMRRYIYASNKERVRITGSTEIDNENKISVSWSEVVKGGKHVDHTHKNSNKVCEEKLCSGEDNI